MRLSKEVIAVLWTNPNLKFYVESIGDGLGAIEEATSAANAKNGIFPILAACNSMPIAQFSTKIHENLYGCCQRLDQKFHRRKFLYHFPDSVQLTEKLNTGQNGHIFKFDHLHTMYQYEILWPT